MNKNVIHEWADRFGDHHRLIKDGDAIIEQMLDERHDHWFNCFPRHSAAVPELGKALERIKELEAKTAWQPIETAPKDGELVLVWDECRNSCAIAHHYDCGWLEGFHEYWIFKPTHWMPLPSAPKKEETR